VQPYLYINVASLNAAMKMALLKWLAG